MSLETWLPFARPRLASVAAFVGEERERERAQREERVRSQAREEALTEFGELTREVSHLVPRLARMHDDSRVSRSVEGGHPHVPPIRAGLYEIITDEFAIRGKKHPGVAEILRRFQHAKRTIRHGNQAELGVCL